MKILIPLFLFCVSLVSHAQKSNTKHDSLYKVWLDEGKADSIRFSAFEDYIWDGYLFSDPDSANILAESLIAKAKEDNNKKWQAVAINMQGISWAVRGQYRKALEKYNVATIIFEEIGHTTGIAQSLNSAGLAHSELGNTPKAIECFDHCIEIHEKNGNRKGLANPLNNLGLIYKHQEKFEEALTYYSRSFELHKQFNNLRGMANTTMNKGVVFYRLNKPAEALKEYDLCLKLFTELDDRWGMSSACMNLGETHSDQGNYEEALKYLQQSLELEKETRNKEGEASSLNGIANIYRKMGKLEDAETHGKQSLELAIETGSVQWIKYAARTLKEIYKDQKKGMMALEMFELQVQMQDSIKSEEAKKGLLKMEVEHEYEKQQLIAEQKQAETARIEAEKIARRNSLQYSGIGLGLFALFGLVFLFGRIQLPNWAVELSVFLPFLILFEFLLVITDPYVDAWSGGQPLIKLGINVLMAALIFPAHSFLERFLKGRLFKKIV